MQSFKHMVKYMVKYIFIMASKTITITEEVYNLLKDLKQNGESFSELLKRLGMQVNGQKLNAFFGSWDINDHEYEEIQEEIKQKKSFFINNSS